MMDAVECMKAVTRMLKSGTIDCAIQKYISAQKRTIMKEWWKLLLSGPLSIPSKPARAICPLAISAAYRHGNGACNKDNSDTCADCKREFWYAEVEE